MDQDGIDAISGRLGSFGVQESPEKPPPFMGYDTEPPPAPQIHSRGVVATDITKLFKKAAETLEVGQLIKDPFFTLFESVGAIEIMDPKMDTGYLAAGETMEDDYDVGKALLPEEVIGIIDKLLCLEMAWHMGHPLSQTVFTSLHINSLLVANPTKVEDACFDHNQTSQSIPLSNEVLRAYCLGLVKTCCHVNNRVKSEHFYEEEDFVTHTYNRSLLEDIDDGPILEAIEQVQKHLQSNPGLTPDIRNCLDQRLRFRAAFLRTVALADERTSSDLHACWTDMLLLLPGLRVGMSLAHPVPDSFSAKLQRKLASTVPPRPVVDVSYDSAYEQLERLCQDGQILVEVLKYYDSHSLMTFVSLFQSRKPQPSVYIRTLLQHYLFGDMVVLGTMSIRKVLDDDLASIVLPEDQLLDPFNDEIEVPHDPRFNMAQRMEMFRSRAAQSYLDILRTLCQNRCRIRRTLNHTIADWDSLQLDAEEVDQDLQQFTKEEPLIDESFGKAPIFAFPLSSWAYFYKLRQMEWIVQMGFELEVYRTEELAGMYWYLQTLTRTRTRHLERIRGFVSKRFLASKRAQKALSQSDISFGRALSYINFSMLEATATQGFADALSSLYIVLARVTLLPISDHPYSDDKIRYELRMKPFLQIVLPEFISHEQFRIAVTQPNESTKDIITYAADAAARAKKDFELLSKLDPKTARCQGSEQRWKANVKDCLKAAISTSITISMVKSAVEKADGHGEVQLTVEIPETGEGYHDWWIIPKIMVRK